MMLEADRRASRRRHEMNPPSPELANWLALLESRHTKPIDLGLARVGRVKERLGIPFDCPVVMVGGTNGKGSTCAMLESILTHAGYRVGVYTSPHLLTFNERVRIAGKPVADTELVRHFEIVELQREEESLTYFEFTTLAALNLFSESRLNAVVLEVGLGGRLDAVNLIDADVAIVTNVDLDHTEFLGNTREEIGYEKAGIFRATGVAICNDPAPPRALLKHALALGADLWLAGRDFRYGDEDGRWSYRGRQRGLANMPHPNLPGSNQLSNASAVLAALEALAQRLPVSERHIHAGLGGVHLPGRFQVIMTRPTVVLDVAHNPHAAEVLARNLAAAGTCGHTYAVFGAMRDKDIEGVIKHMKAVDHWHLTDLPGARAASSEYLLTRVLDAGAPASAVAQFKSPAEAFRSALEHAGERDRIVVFGSFLTVAGVLDAIRRNEVAARRARSGEEMAEAG